MEVFLQNHMLGFVIYSDRLLGTHVKWPNQSNPG